MMADDRRRTGPLGERKSLETTGPLRRDEHAAIGTRRCCRPATATRTCGSTTGPRRYTDDWFIPDGIHFTSHGYAERGRLIADALLEAFPNTHPVEMKDADNCLISTS